MNRLLHFGCVKRGGWGRSVRRCSLRPPTSCLLAFFVGIVLFHKLILFDAADAFLVKQTVLATTSTTGAPLFVAAAATATTASATTETKIMKRILVTGSNTGIGKAICERLLKEWTDTYVILCSRNVERGQEAVQDIIEQDEQYNERIELLELDTSSDVSVQNAASKISTLGYELYGIVNNAGIGPRNTMKDTIETNYFGPRRVTDAFMSHLKDNGRIVNIASASAPVFVSHLSSNDDVYEPLAKPWTIGIDKGVTKIDRIANDAIANAVPDSDAYGTSKALLNAYTVLMGKMYIRGMCTKPDGKRVIMNSCSPGYIRTNMTKRQGATNPPSMGAVAPCYLLMSQDQHLTNGVAGRYYGSDCVRSPLDVYRGPGDPPFVDGDVDETGFLESLKRQQQVSDVAMAPAK